MMGSAFSNCSSFSNRMTANSASHICEPTSAPLMTMRPSESVNGRMAIVKEIVPPLGHHLTILSLNASSRVPQPVGVS